MAMYTFYTRDNKASNPSKTQQINVHNQLALVEDLK